MTSVLLADDQAMIRGALAALLGLEADIDVVAQVGRGDEVLDAVRAHRPDVAVLDIEMPGMTGIQAAAALRDAGMATPVLIVTTFGEPHYLRDALAAGARGFVVKDMPAAQLASAIRRVHAGEIVIDPELAARTITTDNPLTQREREVLALAANGATIKALSRDMCLSQGTIRNYLSSAMAKTGGATRVEAARIAQERGWLSG